MAFAAGAAGPVPSFVVLDLGHDSAAYHCAVACAGVVAAEPCSAVEQSHQLACHCEAASGVLVGVVAEASCAVVEQGCEAAVRRVGIVAGAHLAPYPHSELDYGVHVAHDEHFPSVLSDKFQSVAHGSEYGHHPHHHIRLGSQEPLPASGYSQSVQEECA